MIRMLKIGKTQNHRRQEINLFQIDRKKLKLKECPAIYITQTRDARLGDFNAWLNGWGQTRRGAASRHVLVHSSTRTDDCSVPRRRWILKSAINCATG